MRGQALPSIVFCFMRPRPAPLPQCFQDTNPRTIADHVPVLVIAAMKYSGPDRYTRVTSVMPSPEKFLGGGAAFKLTIQGTDWPYETAFTRSCSDHLRHSHRFDCGGNPAPLFLRHQGSRNEPRPAAAQ